MAVTLTALQQADLRADIKKHLRNRSKGLVPLQRALAAGHGVSGLDRETFAAVVRCLGFVVRPKRSRPGCLEVTNQDGSDS